MAATAAGSRSASRSRLRVNGNDVPTIPAGADAVAAAGPQGVGCGRSPGAPCERPGGRLGSRGVLRAVRGRWAAQLSVRSADDGEGAGLRVRDGHLSSRKLAKKVEEDIAFRMLAAGNFPQHRTLCEFRRRHLDDFRAVFAEVVRLARTMGLAGLGTGVGGRDEGSGEREQAQGDELRSDGQGGTPTASGNRGVAGGGRGGRRSGGRPLRGGRSRRRTA